MPSRPRSVEERERRKEALFGRLQSVYDRLDALQDAHNATPYGCGRSGRCCQVGLQLHMAECEHVARRLEERFAADPALRPRVIDDLLGAFGDEAWRPSVGIGDLFCAFYKDGCTIYPFRPAVCRMYGVVLELNDDCPRRRLASGDAFVYVGKEVDAVVRDLYRVLDDYGRMFPRLDHSIYFASGLLRWLLPADEWRAVRARTPSKFWRPLHGYRSQFVRSTERKPRIEVLPASLVGRK